MLLILRLCNLFIARSFLPATLEQHIMGTDSVVGSVKRFSSRKDILSDTEAFLNVSNDLKDALFKALRRNK